MGFEALQANTGCGFQPHISATEPLPALPLGERALPLALHAGVLLADHVNNAQPHQPLDLPQPAIIIDHRAVLQPADVIVVRCCLTLSEAICNIIMLQVAVEPASGSFTFAERQHRGPLHAHGWFIIPPPPRQISCRTGQCCNLSQFVARRSCP